MYRQTIISVVTFLVFFSGWTAHSRDSLMNRRQFDEGALAFALSIESDTQKAFSEAEKSGGGKESRKPLPPKESVSEKNNGKTPSQKEFVPSEKIEADKVVDFPVDI